MHIKGYDEWLWKQADEYMERMTHPDEDDEDREPYCPHCKRHGCCCDEIYEAYQDRMRGW